MSGEWAAWDPVCLVLYSFLEGGKGSETMALRLSLQLCKIPVVLLSVPPQLLSVYSPGSDGRKSCPTVARETWALLQAPAVDRGSASFLTPRFCWS